LPVWVWAATRDLLIADISSPIIQNKRADQEDLSRMKNKAMVRRFVQHGYLVRVPSSTRYYYLHAIPSAFHYCRPWTKLFLARLSREFYGHFHHKLRVTSLVRTVVSQQRLARRNGNAANAFGPLRSSHLTGATVDISKHFMSRKGIDWMRRVLYSIRDKGYIYAIEEFQQPTFHVMVFENYPQYVKLLTASR
jgi:hypothetical protein